MIDKNITPVSNGDGEDDNFNSECKSIGFSTTPRGQLNTSFRFPDCDSSLIVDNSFSKQMSTQGDVNQVYHNNVTKRVTSYVEREGINSDSGLLVYTKDQGQNIPRCRSLLPTIRSESITSQSCSTSSASLSLPEMKGLEDEEKWNSEEPSPQSQLILSEPGKVNVANVEDLKLGKRGAKTEVPARTDSIHWKSHFKRIVGKDPSAFGREIVEGKHARSTTDPYCSRVPKPANPNRLSAHISPVSPGASDKIHSAYLPCVKTCTPPPKAASPFSLETEVSPGKAGPHEIQGGNSQLLDFILYMVNQIEKVCKTSDLSNEEHYCNERSECSVEASTMERQIERSVGCHQVLANGEIYKIVEMLMQINLKNKSEEESEKLKLIQQLSRITAIIIQNYFDTEFATPVINESYTQERVIRPPSTSTLNQPLPPQRISMCQLSASPVVFSPEKKPRRSFVSPLKISRSPRKLFLSTSSMTSSSRTCPPSKPSLMTSPYPPLGPDQVSGKDFSHLFGRSLGKSYGCFT